MSAPSEIKIDRRYMKLVQQFPLRPIRNKRELEKAMKIAGHLATFNEGTLPSGEQDYLDALTVFIEEYQRRHLAGLPETTALDMLKHLMEERTMSVTELGRIIGSQSNASLILGGKRAISKRVMRLLGEHFAVAPSLFL